MSLYPPSFSLFIATPQQMSGIVAAPSECSTPDEGLELTADLVPVVEMQVEVPELCVPVKSCEETTC